MELSEKASDKIFLLQNTKQLPQLNKMQTILLETIKAILFVKVQKSIRKRISISCSHEMHHHQ